jgi:methionyl-tRNA formyltransferase
LNGDKTTGVSLMYMTKELDAGNIIYQESITIDQYETYTTLYDKLANLSYQVLKNKIINLFNNNVSSEPQDVNLVTIAKNITREDEKINWSNSNIQVEQQIRGLYDKPIAYTVYNGDNIKIYEGFAVDFNNETTIGSIVQIDKEGIAVVCGNHKLLKITKLQLPGKKIINVKDMINGNHPFRINTTFTC